MIKRIYLQNFRGIAEGDIQGFTQINLLVGPNNSGKTTILEALYLAATADRLAQASIQTRTETKFNDVYLSAEKDMHGIMPMSRVWQRHNIPPTWENTASQWTDGKIALSGLREPLDILRSFALPEWHTFVAGEEQRIALLRAVPELVSSDGGEATLQIPSFVETFFGEKAFPLDHRSFLLTWHPLFTYNFNGVGGWFVEVEGKDDLPSASNTLLHDFHTTSENLMADLIDRGYSETDSFLRRIGLQIKEIFDFPNEPYITFDIAQNQQQRRHASVEENQRMLPVDLWGDGMRHAIKMIAPLLILNDDASKGTPGLVLWEDPELFMNPQTLRALIRHIARMIQDKPVQLFMTTQSIEVIACLNEMLRDGALPETSVRAFQLNRWDGKQRVAQFDHDSLTTWLKFGMDPRFWEQQDSSLTYHLGDVE